MALRDRELITPQPTLAGLKELSLTAVVAMLFAIAVVILDAATSDKLVFIGLLAIPAVIAATSASLPETAVVAVFCIVLAALSPLWGGFDGGQRLVSGAVVVAGALGGIWFASCPTPRRSRGGRSGR